MSTTGGAHRPKKAPLSSKTVDQLRVMARRVGAKQTNPDGGHKTKAQLISSIHRASGKHHGGTEGGAHRKKKH